MPPENGEPDPQPLAEIKPQEVARGPEALMGKLGADFWTSLNAKDDDEEALIHRAKDGVLEQLADKVGMEFSMSHILMHIAPKNMEDGEVKDLLRLVLITPEGECFGTFSDGVRDSLKTVFNTRGYPPWPNPLKFKVAQRKTSRGFKQLYLERVIKLKQPPPPEAAANKNKA